MTDLNVPPAGWYPDPNANDSERWWGGTDWTANTRPLNSTPTQAPPPPVPAAVTLPPAGWYPDPQNPAGEKWFDGASWTQATRQRPAQQYAGAPGQMAGEPGWQAGVPGRSAGWQGGARFRWVSSGSGPVGSLVGLAVGLVFVAGALFFVFSTSAPANMSASATGTVTSIRVTQPIQSRSTSQSSGPSCFPVAEFAVGGKTYNASMSVGLSPCPWTVGQLVAVAYDPTAPTEAMIPATGQTKYLPWLFGGIGVLLAGWSLFSLVRSIAAMRAAGSFLMGMVRRRKPTTA